jgi:hypothetical protein
MNFLLKPIVYLFVWKKELTVMWKQKQLTPLHIAMASFDIDLG